MLGAVLVFLGVCAIVATYMYIVHRFLTASEASAEPEEQPEKHETTPDRVKGAPREQWAH